MAAVADSCGDRGTRASSHSPRARLRAIYQADGCYGLVVSHADNVHHWSPANFPVFSLRALTPWHLVVTRQPARVDVNHLLDLEGLPAQSE
jgi:hypothetical protein